jgi:hypothetical protein
MSSKINQIIPQPLKKECKKKNTVATKNFAKKLVPVDVAFSYAGFSNVFSNYHRDSMRDVFVYFYHRSECRNIRPTYGKNNLQHNFGGLKLHHHC